ncbi:MAG: hypothetical protein SOS22_05580 [Absicoccus sp.]|uniref:Transporter n=1 Tax=Absicoccus intestinalis TaxID=2926319 RepID=A0ABU4WPT6_9FIRM|nr:MULTISPECIES: hypothetical protein [unclassified Absicoccus]MDX8417535.1 hypothetical protein [Absicoccus sp. CLA-KB-P134]MDY3035670.1 hypothetical protein [Absicoccus sp.]
MKKINEFSIWLLHWIEVIMAIILILVVVIQCFDIIAQLPSFFFNKVPLSDVLSYVFNFIITIEFVRMLLIHSMESVTEVLIFAIARSIIVGHPEAIALFFEICCIFLLLSARKYLLFENELEKENEEDQ